jgi:uncharacterized protein YehS (DUF1456 family)
LTLAQEEILEIYRLEGYEMSPEHLEALLKKRVDKEFELCSYEELGVFLDGLVTLKRGPSPKRPNDDEAVPLTNNLILKKLRIALELKEPEMEIIFGLGEVTLSKQELKSLFRKEEHKNFKACSDELLDAFLDGLDEFYYTGEEI